MKTHEGSEGIAPQFFTSVLDGGEWSALNPGRFIFGANWIEGWVGTTVDLNSAEKIIILALPKIKPKIPRSWDP
jgi:hypothetical protein